MDFSFLAKFFEKANFIILVIGCALAGATCLFFVAEKKVSALLFLTLLSGYYLLVYSIWYFYKRILESRAYKKVLAEKKAQLAEKNRRDAEKERQRTEPFRFVYKGLSEEQKIVLKKLASLEPKMVDEGQVCVSFMYNDIDTCQLANQAMTFSNNLPPIYENLIELEQSSDKWFVTIDRDFYDVIANDCSNS